MGLLADTEEVLVVATDRAQGCAVLIIGTPGDDAQWRAYARIIDELQSQTPPQIRPVLIQIMRPTLQVPSPIVRRELALLRTRIRPDAVNAVVAEETTVRLVQTALDWLHRPHYASSTHANFPAALAQVEKVLGRPMPTLERLRREALEKSAAASG